MPFVRTSKKDIIGLTIFLRGALKISLHLRKASEMIVAQGYAESVSGFCIIFQGLGIIPARRIDISFFFYQSTYVRVVDGHSSRTAEPCLALQGFAKSLHCYITAAHRQMDISYTV